MYDANPVSVGLDRLQSLEKPCAWCSVFTRPFVPFSCHPRGNYQFTRARYHQHAIGLRSGKMEFSQGEGGGRSSLKKSGGQE